MKKAKVFGSLCAVFLLIQVSCTKSDYGRGNLYTPTEADVTANATLQELQQGKELYIANCGECHYLYSPDDFSASSWGPILSGMAPRTPMTSEETRLVKEYVTRGQ